MTIFFFFYKILKLASRVKFDATFVYNTVEEVLERVALGLVTWTLVAGRGEITALEVVTGLEVIELPGGKILAGLQCRAPPGIAPVSNRDVRGVRQAS